MAMFKKVEQPVKFWISQDGVLGTAHMGRDGNIKDFRPAKAYELYGDIEYTPAPGVDLPTECVPYKRVSVEYRPGDGPVITLVKNPIRHVDPIVMAHAPETMRIEDRRLYIIVSGFPPPAWKEAEIEAFFEDSARKAESYKVTYVTKEEFLAWVSSLPKGSIEFRWVARFARTGKARMQLINAANAAFSGKSTLPSEDTLRQWLTEESVASWRGVLYTSRPAGYVLAFYENEAGDRTLAEWLMHHDGAYGCTGPVDYEEAAASLRAEAEAEAVRGTRYAVEAI